ncbi:unnamed protein product [Cochlearia groenlandica]
MENDRYKLFVGGIARETSEEALVEHFSRYGVVLGAVVAKEKDTGQSRGFGFVRFGNEFDFVNALGVSHYILGRLVDVRKAIPKHEQIKIQHPQQPQNNGGKKLFVGGLSPTTTEDEFKSYFEKFGETTDVVVMHDGLTNRPRGFGFVTFDSEDSVEIVMQSSFHELSGKLVEVKRAIPKDAINNGYNNRNFLPPSNGFGMFGQYSPLPVYSVQGFNYPYGYPLTAWNSPVMPQTGYSTNGLGHNPKNNASSNPFGPKPFGASTTFGAQTGSSMFGGTSTGVFGAPQASSSPFGASSQAFGSPTPAFGSSPSPFGATSAFGQNSFGVSTPQSSPFGNTTQQSQPAFWNSTFGSSTPFGASNTSAFGASTTPTFGTTSTPGFGATSTPGFGATSTPGFGATNTPAFGTSSTPAFGSTNTPAFGASSTPSFGTTNSPGFGASSTLAFGNNAFGSNAFGNNAQNTSAFGTPSTSAFGASSTPAFGASSTPAFGASSTPSFSFGSSPAFGNGSFASTQSPFGTQGAQASITTFGGQQGGSRVMPYTPTAEVDSGTGSSQPAGKVQSISAMPVHNNKCHGELRWEDYQKGDKGGKRLSGQSAGVATFGVPNPQPNLFTQSPTFSQTSASLTSTNPFGQNTPTPTSNFAPPYGQNTNPPVFGQTPSTTTSGFGSSPGFATTTSQPFSSSSTPGFSSSQSIFSSAPAQVSTPTFNSNFNNSQSSPLFSSNPSLGQQTSSAFTQQQTSSPFGQQQATSAINTNPGFAQTSNFSTPSTGFKNMFSSSSSLTTSTSPFSQTMPASLTQPFQSAKPTQPSGAFSFNNFGQTQTAITAGFTNGMGSFSQGNFGPAPANNAVMQPTPITNPFGTLPALPQVSITQGGSSPSIQYGISSLPIVDKPALARVSSLLTSRHLLQRRVKLPARKYHPNDDSPKVPFFSDEVENSYTPKADAVLIPRENPRALFIRPVEKEKSIVSKDRPTPLQENGKSSNGVTDKEDVETSPVKTSPKRNGSDIASLLPKLHHAEYFTEPRVQELAAKEKANPGYCSRVKDFVIGRHGYGNIKFLGETDVRSLDIETMVQFNNREVIVYMDESLKPPVGHGLNKPSEVTLLNIKCMDKKTGKQVKEEGARLDKYKEMLKRKGEEQGAEFVSYDCVSGEWKFKVQHF